MKVLSKQITTAIPIREYSVHCQVTENALPLIDLTIAVPSEAEAQAATDNWQKKNQELYALLRQSFLDSHSFYKV